MKFVNNVETPNLVLTPVSTPPADVTIGQIYFNATDNSLYKYDGTAWAVVGGAASEYKFGVENGVPYIEEV